MFSAFTQLTQQVSFLMSLNLSLFMGIESYLDIGKPDEKKEITIKSALSDVVFEEKAVYDGKEKRLYTYDASLRALRARGYERHPRPVEAFDLICRGLEGTLQPDQQAIADNMLNGYGEWLSMAIMQEENMLHCYLDPENLVWNGYQYVVQGGKLKHAGEEVYSIGSLLDWSTPKGVNEINPFLVQKLWSRPYAILPEEIRQNTWLYLPPENVLMPVSRGNRYGCGYGIDACFFFRASLGILQRK